MTVAIFLRTIVWTFTGKTANDLHLIKLISMANFKCKFKLFHNTVWKVSRPKFGSRTTTVHPWYKVEHQSKQLPRLPATHSSSHLTLTSFEEVNDREIAHYKMQNKHWCLFFYYRRSAYRVYNIQIYQLSFAAFTITSSKHLFIHWFYWLGRSFSRGEQ